MKKAILMLVTFIFIGLQVDAQKRTITGTVTGSEDGQPLPGVSVMVKGTTYGVVTNIDGKYTVDVDGPVTLVFSFVGMATKEVVTANSKNIDVQLSPKDFGVDEVIVTAYGTSKKSAFTGSATDVNVDDLEKIPTESISKALEGLSTGVSVVNSTGQPGENAIIRIRGIGSVNASSAPMYVVDGFPYGGNINSIHPSDIENMTVLKDAAATSLYGSRAANGVIIITTKKGKKNTSNFEIKYNHGITTRAIPDYERVDVPTYYEMMWERLYNDNTDLGTMTDNEAREAASADLIPALGNYNAFKNVNDEDVVNPTTGEAANADLKWTDDWQEELFRTARRHDVVLSASGGTDKSTYFLSGNVLSADGIVTASNFKRYSARANITSQVKSWAKASMGISASTQKQNYPNSDGTSYVNSFMWTRNIAPIYPVYLYDKDGELQYDGEGNKVFDYGDAYGRNRVYSSNSNPLGVIGLDTRLYQRDIASARGDVEFKFLNDFTFTVAGSADFYGYLGMTHQNALHGDAETFQGRSTRTSSRNMTLNFNQLLRWNRSFNGHNVYILAGHESYQYVYNRISATRTGFPFGGIVELDGAATAEGSSSYEDNLRMESYLADFKYDFGDKYFVSFSLRTDGSSRFHPDNRWGTFWSVGGSWIISKEAFMSGVSVLDELRLKGSFGQQGNDRVGYYAYQALYDLGYNNINRSGLIASRLATPELKWEKQNILNVGIHAQLLKRIELDFEYFERGSSDLLFEKPLPLSTGFDSYEANIGAIANKGIELSLSTMLINNSTVKWELGLNMTKYKNEFTELPQEEMIVGNKKYMVGRSIYEYFVREYAGVNPETGASQWYKDVYEVDDDGELILDDNDKPIVTGKEITEDYNNATRYYAGTRIPDLSGGVNSTINVYNFTLSFLLTYNVGGKIYDYNYSGLMGSDFGDNLHVDMLDRWTPDNTDTDVPRFDSDQNMNATSDRFLVDASYLAINQIYLGYNLPKAVAGKIYMSQADIFISASNLGVYSKKQGLDPRQFLSGNAENVYSPLRVVSLGVNLKF